MTATIVTTLNIPAFGQRWDEHNGILVGLQHLHGKFRALIRPEGDKFKFHEPLGAYGVKVEFEDEFDDGMAGTIAFAKAGSPVCQKVLELEDDRGNKDFFVPAAGQNHHLFSHPDVRKICDTEDWQWSVTPHGSHGAWYQYFGDGSSLIDSRGSKALVRPLRSVIL